MQDNEFGRADHTLSVVVCTYDRYGLLDQAIASLLRQDVADFEIIIVDNSPNQQRAQEHGLRYAVRERVTYVLEPRPGLSRAQNIGVARARGSIVAFIDDDATADPGRARAIIDTFETFPGNVAVVGGIVAPRWTAEHVSGLIDPARVPQGTQDRVNAIYALVLSCLEGEAVFNESSEGALALGS